jgi:hypothetical protein
MVRHLAVSLLSACLLLGCSATQGKSDAGPQRLKSCTSNSECGALSCDLARLQCVCTQDAMCSGDTPYCNVFTGRCETALPAGSCTADSCGAGHYCDQSVRTCKATLGFCSPCSSSEQCGSNNYCVVHPDYPETAKFCAGACGTNDVCPSGQTCKQTAAGVKQCVPEGEVCGGSVRCNADSLDACGTDHSCAAAGQHCDGTLQRCVADVTGCAQDQVCDPRTLGCVQPCGVTNAATGDSECRARFGGGSDAGVTAAGDFVCINHVCRPTSQCSSDDQCALNQFCAHNPTAPAGSLGNCEPSCVADADCPLAQRCLTDPVSGRLGCSNACQSNHDCPLTAICLNGQCALHDMQGRNYCQTKQVCDFLQSCDYIQASGGSVCVTKGDQCTRANPLCPGTEKSKGIGWYACGACPLGSTQSGCSPSYPRVSGCSQNSCLCTANRCLAICQSTDDCPKGLDCTSLLGDNVCAPNQDGQLCFSPP